MIEYDLSGKLLNGWKATSLTSTGTSGWQSKGGKRMISIWEGLAWAVIGLLAGIILGDPNKKKYFN